MKNKEKLMVCVYYGPHGERLIRRAGQLAKLLQSPLFVLSVIPVQEDELDPEQERMMAAWKLKCEEWGATFIVKPNENRKSSEMIAETATHLEITQLIIGQSGQTRWQEITHGSFVNELLHRIGETDLHIVAVQRMKEQAMDMHKPGVPVSVYKKEQHYHIGDSEARGLPVTKGVFSKL
ncbi:universal stress protein [Paenibacillus sp. FSL H8-0548]|uniref:universal stress protein n=1 Tax=Paenibacillus sp. FSL H8-0548 TaxID=1920422 RepID=UPI002116FC05|nr:universal stress protein [Paenibacillus sp. FSL H8-0548]